VFNIERYVIIEKRAVFLAVTSLVGGMSLMLVELGHPERIAWAYFDSPNPASPIFGMGVIYSMDLVLISSELALLMTRNPKMARRVGVLAMFTALAAGSTVGSVFGLPYTKPFWSGPYLPIDFILCAWITGFAIMIIASYSTAKDDVHRTQLLSLVDGMGTWLAIFLVTDMFFLLWKTGTGLYGASEGASYLATEALVRGPLSVTFWIGEVFIGLVIPLAILVVPGLKKASTTVVAAIFAIIGMFASKVNILQAPETIPLRLFGQDAYRTYFPSMVEISIVVGAIACILLLYALADRYQLLTHDA